MQGMSGARCWQCVTAMSWRLEQWLTRSRCVRYWWVLTTGLLTGTPLLGDTGSGTPGTGRSWSNCYCDTPFQTNKHLKVQTVLLMRRTEDGIDHDWFLTEPKIPKFSLFLFPTSDLTSPLLCRSQFIIFMGIRAFTCLCSYYSRTIINYWLWQCNFKIQDYLFMEHFTFYVNFKLCQRDEKMLFLWNRQFHKNLSHHDISHLIIKLKTSNSDTLFITWF